MISVIFKKYNVLRSHTGFEGMPLTFVEFGLISDPFSYEKGKKVKKWNVKSSVQQMEQRGFLKCRMKLKNKVGINI